MQSGNSQTGGQLEVPETTEQTATAWSSSAAVGLHAEMNPKDTGTSVFTAARFTVAEARKQPKCAPSDKWLKVSYKYIYTHTYIHTMQYCSAIKKRLFPAKWMDLEMIILSEGSQTENNKEPRISLMGRI